MLINIWKGGQLVKSLLALYPGGIPRREPLSCEAPGQRTIYQPLT